MIAQAISQGGAHPTDVNVQLGDKVVDLTYVANADYRLKVTQGVSGWRLVYSPSEWESTFEEKSIDSSSLVTVLSERIPIWLHCVRAEESQGLRARELDGLLREASDAVAHLEEEGEALDAKVQRAFEELERLSEELLANQTDHQLTKDEIAELKREIADLKGAQGKSAALKLAFLVLKWAGHPNAPAVLGGVKNILQLAQGS